jgi:hypothetical protein
VQKCTAAADSGTLSPVHRDQPVDNLISSMKNSQKHTAADFLLMAKKPL